MDGGTFFTSNRLRRETLAVGDLTAQVNQFMFALSLGNGEIRTLGGSKSLFFAKNSVLKNRYINYENDLEKVGFDSHVRIYFWV